jgi:hypothetical protein
MLKSRKGDLMMLRDQAAVAWDQCLKHYGETKQSCSSDVEFWGDIKVQGVDTRVFGGGLCDRGGGCPMSGGGVASCAEGWGGGGYTLCDPGVGVGGEGVI